MQEESAMLGRRQFLHLTAAAVAGAAAPTMTRAQSYPTHPVRLIAPFAPGGPTDVAARLIAQKLSEQLGKQFYVENIGGAGGNIGTGQAARAAPDGYTVLITANSHVINPNLFERVPYDVNKDFEPVTLAVSFASALSVNPSVPAKTVKDLVALIKATPGKYSFASPGLGTPSHLLGEQFKLALGLDIVHVPYTGSGPAVAAALAGHTPIAFAALSAAAPLVKENKLSVLTVLSKTRSQALPEVPTIAEAGYPGLDGDGWIGVFLPARAPKEIGALLHREIVKVISQPDIKERLAAIGVDPVGNTPEEFARQIVSEIEKWGNVIRAANLKVQ
jgi:tripartite-type tricarboxylate transporter receptor subunit TctC